MDGIGKNFSHDPSHRYIYFERFVEMRHQVRFSQTDSSQVEGSQRFVELEGLCKVNQPLLILQLLTSTNIQINQPLVLSDIAGKTGQSNITYTVFRKVEVEQSFIEGEESAQVRDAFVVDLVAGNG